MAEAIVKSEEQTSAEAEVDTFRQALGPFVVAAETTRMAMVFTDAKESGNPIVFANDSFLALTGYARKEVLGQSFNFMLATAGDSNAIEQICREFAGGSNGFSEIRYRHKDGSEFWACVFISPVRNEIGEVVQHFASFVDMTKRIQDHADSLMLIDELNHRVKNTLSTVQSIVWQALRTDAAPDSIRDSIESRLSALSRSHDLLTREKWKGAELLDLVKAVLEPFRATNGHGERVTITGRNIRIQPKTTLALGIALNELATNALKYGALSNEAGSLAIWWSLVPAPEGARLVLHWQEKDGPRVTPPSHRGFGSKILEDGLAHELKGTVRLDFPPEGARCTIDLPAPRGAGDE